MPQSTRLMAPSLKEAVDNLSPTRVQETGCCTPDRVKTPKMEMCEDGTHKDVNPPVSRPKIQIQHEEVKPVYTSGDDNIPDDEKPFAKLYATQVAKEESIQANNPLKNVPLLNKERPIAIKCDDCCKVTIRKMNLAENNVTHCRFCKKEIEITRVEKIEGTCTTCGAQSYLYGTPGIKSVSCINCKSDIEMEKSPLQLMD